ncbi:unnamed protein product [Ectocarpus sp. 8 AP-2014]
MPLMKYVSPQQNPHDVPHYLLYLCPPDTSRFIATPSRSKKQEVQSKNPPTCSEGTRTRTAISITFSPHVTFEQMSESNPTNHSRPVLDTLQKREQQRRENFSLFVQSFLLISHGLLPPSFQSNTRGGRTVS